MKIAAFSGRISFILTVNTLLVDVVGALALTTMISYIFLHVHVDFNCFNYSCNSTKLKMQEVSGFEVLTRHNQFVSLI